MLFVSYSKHEDGTSHTDKRADGPAIILNYRDEATRAFSFSHLLMGGNAIYMTVLYKSTMSCNHRLDKSLDIKKRK